MKENTQVYIITAGPYIKIGHSNNTGQRFNDLQVGCPLQFELVWLSEMTKKPIAEMLETRIHGRFDFQKVRGEWFDTNPIWAIKIAKEMEFEIIHQCDPNLSVEELDDMKFQLQQETEPDPVFV